MIESPEELRAFTSELGVSVWTLSAIATLFESGLVDALVEPRSVDELSARCASLSRGQVERCLAVAAAAGVVGTEGGRYRLAPGTMPFVVPPMRGGLAGDLRATLMQALAFLDGASGERPTTGWRSTNEALLQSQGDASSALAMMLKMRVVPSLEGLEARLAQPGACVLDVGVGVAALSIALCHAFSEVSVVGIDCFDTALAIARRNIAGQNLDSRITLRSDGIEGLRDTATFDLAWLPSFFIPEAAAAVSAVFTALRLGGWLLFATDAPGGDARQQAVWSLIAEQWGGAKIAAAEAETLLRGAGFASVRTLPGPDWAPALVVGRR